MDVRWAEGVAIHEREELASRAVEGDCEGGCVRAEREAERDSCAAYWGREWAAKGVSSGMKGKRCSRTHLEHDSRVAALGVRLEAVEAAKLASAKTKGGARSFTDHGSGNRASEAIERRSTHQGPTSTTSSALTLVDSSPSQLTSCQRSTVAPTRGFPSLPVTVP